MFCRKIVERKFGSFTGTLNSILPRRDGFRIVIAALSTIVITVAVIVTVIETDSDLVS